MKHRPPSSSIAPGVSPMPTPDRTPTGRSSSSPRKPTPASMAAIPSLASVIMPPSEWSRKSPACPRTAKPRSIPSKSRTLISKAPVKPSQQRLPNHRRARRSPCRDAACRVSAARVRKDESRAGRKAMTRTPGTYAVIETSEGTIICRLFEKDAPKTVANFVELSEGKREWTHPTTRKKTKDPLYHGTIFHRVIPNFMIQGGDPMGTGFGGPGYQFEDETKGSPHRFDKAGKLAMANSGPNTNGSQFFITVANTEWLTGKHTIFGEVVEGYEVIEKISKAPKNRQDRPNKDVVVKSVKIER